MYGYWGGRDGEGPITRPGVQLKARGYADKYRASGEPVRLIGVEFCKDSPNLTTFTAERV